MDAGNKVVKGTLWGILGGTITAISGLVIVVILARLLDPIEYGYIPLTFSIVNIISIFADFGISNSTSKFITEYSAKDTTLIRSIIKDSLLLKTIFGLIISIAFFFLAGNIAFLVKVPNLDIFIKVGAIFLFFNGFVVYSDRVLQGFQRIDYNTFRNTVESIFKLFFIVILVLLGYGAIGAFWGYTIGSILSALVGITILYIKFYKIFPDSKRAVHKEILLYSIPLIIVNASYLIYMQMDVFLIAYFLGTDGVAFYSVPNKFVEALRMPAIAIGAAIAPAIAYSKGRFKESPQTGALLYDGIKYVIILSVPIAIAMITVSGSIITIVLGDKYINSIPVFQGFAIFFIMMSITSVSSVTLNYLGRAGIRAKIFSISVLLKIVLDIIWIPVLGVMGAVYSTIISYSLYFFIDVGVCMKECGLKYSSFNNVLIKSLFSSILMGILLILISKHIGTIFELILAISAGTLIYFTSAFLLGLIRIDEIKKIKSKIRFIK